MTRLKGERCTLRRWRRGDEQSLVKQANDHEIWRNVTDRFPYPYLQQHAEEWIDQCELERGPLSTFAIEVDNAAVGAIGLELKDDIYSKTAEIGYWLGRTYWGRGILTEAVGLVTAHGFAAFALVRVQGAVYDWNPASGRVLEKNGYMLEGRFRKGYFKDGLIGDLLIYSRVLD